MDKLDQMKLEIYERCNKGEISQEECNLLLEKAEERYEYGGIEVNLSEDEQTAVECVMEDLMTVEEAVEICSNESEQVTEKGAVDDTVKSISDANKRYTMTVKIMGDAKKEYKENEKKIKTYINEKKYSEAKDAIRKCEKSVMKIKSSIESMKDEPSDAVISFVVGTAKMFLVNTVLDSIGIALGNGKIKIDDFDDIEISPKISIPGEVAKSAIDHGIVAAFKKHKSGTWNTTRGDALKVLNKQLMKLKKLETKINEANKN